MTAAVLHADTPALLDREIDDLLLHMRGLAVVRDILSERGASDAEIAAHSRELEIGPPPPRRADRRGGPHGHPGSLIEGSDHP